jgi:hypothetical protein
MARVLLFSLHVGSDKRVADVRRRGDITAMTAPHSSGELSTKLLDPAPGSLQGLRTLLEEDQPKVVLPRSTEHLLDDDDDEGYSA